MRLILVLALCMTTAGLAQTPDERAFRGVRSLKCEFPDVAKADWQTAQPNPVLKTQEFSFHIDGIDLRARTARMIGNVGAEDLTLIQGSGVIHFLERTPVGNLNVTTVYASRSRQRGFKAVHSRHLTMLGGPFPSQAYGYCREWE